jgi:hypothetical protein
VPVYAWAALAFLIVATLAGAIFAGLGAHAAHASGKQLSRAVRAELERIAEKSERTDRELQAATAALGRLHAALARLEASRARARLLTEALTEVEQTLARARALVPTKDV